MSMHDNYELRISPEKMKVDTTYQRDVDPHKIKRIVDKFNMDLFNAPKVSHRADGFYYVFDGQHSMVAHKKVFGKEEPIKCRVFEGLTYNEEVDLFVQQNGICNPVCTNDKLKALYNNPESDVKDMVNAARTVGIKIDFKHGKYNNHLEACGAAYYAWKLLGKDNFINVLSVIESAWNGESSSLNRGIIKGLALVYKNFGEKITNEKMVTALKRHTPDWYMREAADMKGSMMIRYAKLFVDAYNYNKKATNKIEWAGRE